MKGLAVIGTDTGVGKTVVASMLMAASGPSVHYWKPVQTGAMGESEPDDDTGRVRELAHLDPQRVAQPTYRFALPASPHHAAMVEGRSLCLDDITVQAQKLTRTEGSRWVVEGVGGVMVPLSNDVLWTDLHRALNLPAILVSSTRLGTINHTLLTLAQCRQEGVDVLGVVLLGAPDPSARSGILAHGDVSLLGEIPWMDALDVDRLRHHGRALMDAPRIKESLA